tara:strand:+ start:213 stop:908 length:696 start_codon:yes stop_codon:yes gene_type:complete
MIISHERKFIFIKTEKTAGTSIEIALSKYCGPRDIITPVSPEDEKIRASLGYLGPQNHRVPLRLWNFRQWRKACLRLQWPTFHSHSDARTIRRFLGDTLWKDYFKFCFERNPWDKVISWYHWNCRNSNDRPQIDDFVKSQQGKKVKGFDLYTIDNRVVVDSVYRFEDLNGAMADIAETISLPEIPILPSAKTSQRKDRRPHYKVLSGESVDIIKRRYEREIAMLGYEWKQK